MNELVKYVYNCMIVCTIPRLTLECDEDSGLDFHCPASLLLDEDNQVHVYNIYIYMHKLCTCSYSKAAIIIITWFYNGRYYYKLSFPRMDYHSNQNLSYNYYKVTVHCIKYILVLLYVISDNFPGNTIHITG